MELNTLFILLGIVFVIGYFFIAVEHKSHVNKSGVALVIGALLRVLVALFSHDKHEISSAITENGAEIFSIIIFLLSAMTIVEILVHFEFFDRIREKIMQKKISQKKLFRILGGLTFIMSAFLDNLTTTLIMIQIGRKIYKD